MSAAKDSKTPSVTTKDRITITISVFALLISLSTFGFTRWEKYSEAKLARARDNYSALQLGERFAISFVVYHQVRIGTPEAIQGAASDALRYALLAQGYADKLDLGLDLRSLIEKSNPGERVIPEPETTTIAKRLVAERGRQVADHFSLGFSLAWWNLNIGIANKNASSGNREMLEEFTSNYGALRDRISTLLQSTKTANSLPERMAAPEELGAEIKRIKESVESALKRETAA